MSNIIKFPGVTKGPAQPKEAPTPTAALPVKLSEDQERAIVLIMSGKTFLIVAMTPTASGSDFFTACHGDEDELRNAEQHLPAVIGRLFSRKGIR